jgi:hypothetical protein
MEPEELQVEMILECKASRDITDSKMDLRTLIKLARLRPDHIAALKKVILDKTLDKTRRMNAARKLSAGKHYRSNFFKNKRLDFDLANGVNSLLNPSARKITPETIRRAEELAKKHRAPARSVSQGASRGAGRSASRSAGRAARSAGSTLPWGKLALGAGGLLLAGLVAKRLNDRYHESKIGHED